MELSSSSSVFWFSLCVLVIFCCRGGAIELPGNVTVRALFMFGDSIVDTGNNNNLTTLAKCNFPPYGRDFNGGQPTGRFSNGKVPADFIVEELGIKELLPAYLDPNLQPEDLPTGVNFASGGAGYDPLTAKVETAIPLSDQLKLFKEYTQKLKNMVGEEETNTIFTNSLFIVVVGSNDIANVYYNAHIRQLQLSIGAYTDFMASSASSFLKELYQLGARRIGAFGVPPLGCLPSSRTVAGRGKRDECIKEYNQASELFNTKFSVAIDSLSRNLPDAKVVYIDIYNPLFELIQNPRKYGFEFVDKGCCGSGTLEAAFTCNSLTPTCPDASIYIFWDSYHPAERTYKMLVSEILQKYNFFSYSASICCLLVITIFQVYTSEATVKLQDNVTISAIFMFGDSIVDTGNNNNKLNAVARSNFPPYGRDFMGAKPTGRFSNGKIPSDLIVETLGIKEVLPAYLDPDIQTKDLLTGVSFASAGAGYDPVTSWLVAAISLTKQLQLFEECMERVKESFGEERARHITANSVSIVSAGSNDIANTYFLLLFRILEFNISSYADLLATSASLFLEGLYKQGARKIGVLGSPPLGCMPSSRTVRGGHDRNCVTYYNEAAQLFNSKMKVVLDNLNKKYPQSRMVFIDGYTIMNDIIQNPKKYGFEVADRGCCGTGTFEVAATCNKWSLFTCTNASKYVFWDSYHPTEEAYRILMDYLFPDMLNQLFS
ncbi:uncharacterized protein LOC116141834 [Pistacia vera]|uniref:uncharacterized protein LOC116141834 n=1 Tax=Pistacia vera TaxID=55513 RepID=UPI0012634E76|nr:uncharacterized protein LOC116141834 [Pistacia vera]